MNESSNERLFREAHEVPQLPQWGSSHGVEVSTALWLQRAVKLSSVIAHSKDDTKQQLFEDAVTLLSEEMKAKGFSRQTVVAITLLVESLKRAAVSKAMEEVAVASAEDSGRVQFVEVEHEVVNKG